MPQYSYVCTNAKGQTLHGKIEAPDHDGLVFLLWQKGLFLISWKQEGSPPEYHPAALLDSEKPVYGFLGWIARQSFGTVTNRRQAIAFVIVVVFALVITASNLFYQARMEPNPWRGHIPSSG